MNLDCTGFYMKTLIFGLCLFVTTLGTVVLAQEPSSMETHQQVIILLGPPGSGKGTQAVRMSKQLEIPHISTGDLFRENMSKNTELGQKAKSFINEGKLVPDSLVLDMLFDRVSLPDCKKGYLLDGFPRTLAQAEAFNGQLTPATKLVVFNLDVPDDIIIKRAEGRLTCKDCGAIYNRYFSPPSKEGICDKCGGELFQRSDDKAEVVQERLRVYHEQTKPLIAYYAEKGILQNIDGTKSPDEVFLNLMQKFSRTR